MYKKKAVTSKQNMEKFMRELLIAYFINGLFNPETKAKLKVEGPLSLDKAIEIAEFYEKVLNKNTNLINKSEYLTPPGYSLIDTSSSINSSQHKAVRMMQDTIDNYFTPINQKTP